MALTGTKLTQVPYRGGAPAIIDMTGGRVDLMWGNMPEFMGQIRGGGLRPIGYGADAASPLLPEVPVISKTGLKDFVIHNWFGLVGPGRHVARAAEALERRAGQGCRLAELKQKVRRQRPADRGRHQGRLSTRKSPPTASSGAR
jgi:tripartite-type tricarboxylate transporter receptor subunit TctC